MTFGNRIRTLCPFVEVQWTGGKKNKESSAYFKCERRRKRPPCADVLAGPIKTCFRCHHSSSNSSSRVYRYCNMLLCGIHRSSSRRRRRRLVFQLEKCIHRTLYTRRTRTASRFFSDLRIAFYLNISYYYRTTRGGSRGTVVYADARNMYIYLRALGRIFST